MRKLSWVLVLVVGLCGFGTTAKAGILDLTLYKVAGNGFQAGDITIRNDAGLFLFAVGMRLGGGFAAGSVVTFPPLPNPPSANPAVSFSFSIGPDLYAQANNGVAPDVWMDSGGAEVLLATVTNFGGITAFDCVGCVTQMGGAAFTDADGFSSSPDTTDISAQVMYFLVPEPAPLGLTGLALAALLFLRARPV